MHRFLCHCRHWGWQAALVMGLASFALVPVTLGAGGPALFLRPHCEQADQTQCPSFDVNGPDSVKTSVLKVGDVLDLDVMVSNPDSAPVHEVRAWLSYDTHVFDGILVNTGDKLGLPLPGESDFSFADGLVKIGAAAEQGAEPADALLSVARVKLYVKSIPDGDSSPVSFYDLRPTTLGHTLVALAAAPNQNALTGKPQSLIAQFPGSAPLLPTQPATGSGTQQAAPPPSARGPQSTPFTLLQVQNLRVTTQGTALLLKWDALVSPLLKGYNVYYGSQTGRYIQRRSVGPLATDTVIENLPKGHTFYAAVRAVDTQGDESVFSQEQAVQIGDPRTSTAPLLATLDGMKGNNGTVAPPNPLSGQTTTTVPGAAGTSSTALLFVLIAGVIGMIVAFRRQLLATPSPRL